MGTPAATATRWKPVFQAAPRLRVPSGAMARTNGSPEASASANCCTASPTSPPARSRSMGMPPKARRIQPSGGRNSWRLARMRASMPQTAAAASPMMPSQLEVCGQPMRTCRGTSAKPPVKRQPRTQSTSRPMGRAMG